MAGKKTGKRLLTWVLVLVMALSLLPLNALAARNSTVVLHPSVGSTVTGVKVKVGDIISGYKVSSISGYGITVDLGKYNVNNNTFRLPYAKDIWKGVDNNKVDYISWAGSGSNKRSEGASALLANGKNTAYYYFKGAPVLLTFTLNYDANGGTGAPASQTYKATSEYEKSHTFTIPSQAPTRDGYTFLGWNTIRSATTANYQPNGSIVVTGTTTLYAVWEENTPPKPDKPTAPDEDDLSGLIGDITVKCTNDKATHTPKSKGYALISGSYTTSEVEGDAESGYTYTVTINAQEYVKKFDADTGAVHTPKEDTATVTLEYKNNAWYVKTATPIVFNVVCDETPDDPKVGDNFDFDKNIVDVFCETTSDHDYSYGLMNDYYTVSDRKQLQNGNWQCEITINLDKYFALYNSEHPGHTRDMKHEKATAIKTIYPTWSAKSRQWSCAESLIDAAEIYVKCDAVTPPTEPSKEDIKELLGSNAVQIICTNNESGHGSKTFGLIDGTFSVRYDGQYTCEVKIDSFYEYVKKFNTDLGVAHISDASKTSEEKSIVNLKWEDGKWTVMDAPAKHYVLCETPKYTVTYTDGVDGEVVFADQVYDNLSSGTDTPAFDGTPTRDGYVFAGWKPAVAEKVTENATYTAQWKEDKNHNGTPDDEEEKYTVTYTDGVDGEEVFADQVYRDLLSGIDTPAFNGTPARDGYVFDGWKPAFSDTVTGNVTYVAQWTARTDLSYTVHYYLKNTTKQVANDKMVAGQTFNADVTENAIRISGYRVYGDSVKSITIGTGTNEIIFYYTRAYHPSTPSKPTLNTGDHYAYVMGYPDGTVRPNGSITRAEVSAILFRLLSDETRDEYFTTESSFTDVKAGAWYNNSIATLEKAGVIVDTAKGGAFRPNEAITRAELAAMLAQFSDAKPVKGVKFSDVSAEHWAYEAIAIAAKMGWIEGYPDGTFRPDATITRAEMMTLVNRALERVPSDEDHLLSKRVMLTFPDCKSGDWFYIAVQEATNSHTYERAATEKNGDEQWTALRANRDWTQLEK